jgi:hypothetical protein
MITLCFVKESAVLPQRTMCNFYFYFLSAMFPDLQQRMQLYVSRTMFEVIVSGDEDDVDGCKGSRITLLLPSCITGYIPAQNLCHCAIIETGQGLG